MTVGTTRLIGKAGPLIDLVHYLAQDLNELPAPLKIAAQNWTYGTAANQVNIIYSDMTQLADGANTTLDLYASGSLVDIFNRALTLTALKLLYIKNNSSDATLLVGGGAANDLDIWVEASKENAEKVLGVLQEFGFGDLEITVADISKEDTIIQLG